MSLSVDHQAMCVAQHLESRRSSTSGGGILQDGLEMLGLDILSNHTTSSTANHSTSMRDLMMSSTTLLSSRRSSVSEIAINSSGHLHYDEETLEHFCDQVEDMAPCSADVAELIDDENFQNLKHTLRQKGCITNTYIQLKLHKYIKHVRAVKQQKIHEQRRKSYLKSQQQQQQKQKHHAGGSCGAASTSELNAAA